MDRGKDRGDRDMKILKKRDVPVRGRVRPGELWDRYRRSVAVFLLFAGLGAIAQITGTGQGELTGNGALAREPPGKGDRETELVLSVPEIGREAAYVVKVPEQILTREERRDCFARAEREARIHPPPVSPSRIAVPGGLRWRLCPPSGIPDRLAEEYHHYRHQRTLLHLWFCAHFRRYVRQCFHQSVEWQDQLCRRCGDDHQ